MSAVEYGLMTQELERGDSGVRSFVSVQSALCMYPIYAFGSEEQKQKYLPKMALGEILGCFGLTEPDAGSNPGAMRTRATQRRRQLRPERREDVDHLRLHRRHRHHLGQGRGRRRPHSRLHRRDRPPRIQGRRRARQVVAARVGHLKPFAYRTSAFPPKTCCRKSGGLKSPLSCLNQARYGIGWGAIGAAMACYDCALQYAQFRKQFHDMPIASHQLVQEKLVWMISEITKAQLLALQVGRLKDAGKVKPWHISMAKRNNVWMALECARMGRDILGGNGIADEYPIFRHMANLESVKTYEGTHDIHTLIIGEHITGHRGVLGSCILGHNFLLRTDTRKSARMLSSCHGTANPGTC